MIAHEFKFLLSYRPINGKRKNGQKIKKLSFGGFLCLLFFLIDRKVIYWCCEYAENDQREIETKI